MTHDSDDEDRALDRALGALAEPELPLELARRLDAIPSRGTVRRFPGRSWRASALGWAAAAAIGLFVGSHWAGEDASETASSGDETAATASLEAVPEADVSLLGDTSSDDEDVALAVGSFPEFEEAP